MNHFIFARIRTVAVILPIFIAANILKSHPFFDFLAKEAEGKAD